MDLARRPITKWATTAVVAGGLGLAGAGLATATAHADPSPMVCQDPTSGPSPTNSCTYQWCPGSPEMRHMPDWDRSVCHPWYFDKDSPPTDSRIIEGFPPPYPPSPPCIPFINCLPGL
ncbi:hypothetical protein [Mycobacterium sp. 1423905.2]|uniref:hypothetical protein n=1 Tax=Mycobacterium sp. 1423905.2 TaxID=1856859 RepID=UPI0012EA1425|nr:hypothetical protein [Mycobacterium sp. 1423905.2]